MLLCTRTLTSGMTTAKLTLRRRLRTTTRLTNESTRSTSGRCSYTMKSSITRPPTVWLPLFRFQALLLHLAPPFLLLHLRPVSSATRPARSPQVRLRRQHRPTRLPPDNTFQRSHFDSFFLNLFSSSLYFLSIQYFGHTWTSCLTNSFLHLTKSIRHFWFRFTLIYFLINLINRGVFVFQRQLLSIKNSNICFTDICLFLFFDHGFVFFFIIFWI